MNIPSCLERTDSRGRTAGKGDNNREHLIQPVRETRRSRGFISYGTPSARTWRCGGRQRGHSGAGRSRRSLDDPAVYAPQSCRDRERHPTAGRPGRGRDRGDGAQSGARGPAGSRESRLGASGVAGCVQRRLGGRSPQSTGVARHSGGQARTSRARLAPPPRSTRRTSELATDFLDRRLPDRDIQTRLWT